MNVKLNLEIFCMDQYGKGVIFCCVDKKSVQTRVKTFIIKFKKYVGLPRAEK